MSIILTHQDFSGWGPFNILKDDLSKPGFLPFKAMPKYWVPWWWKMTAMRVQMNIDFDRNFTDPSGNTWELAGSYALDVTIPVVPDGCKQGADRAEPNGKMGGCIAFGKSDCPTFHMVNTITPPPGGGDPDVSDSDSTPFVSMALMFAGTQTVPFPHVGSYDGVKSPVVVSPDGDYYPSFLFSFSTNGPGSYPVHGAPALDICSWNNTPAEINSGGDPSGSPFFGGFPIVNIGGGTLQEADGTPFVFPLYGYGGDYVLPPTGVPSGWSGSDTTTASVILTPSYT